MTNLHASLSGRRIVITGAGRGLGRSLAIVAADRGADVVLLGRNLDALGAVADVIRLRTQRDAAVVHCDLALPRSIDDACRAVLNAGAAVDVLINNAAPWLPGDLRAVSNAQIVEAISASVTGTILITKGLLPGLMRSTSADIVSIVSTAGWPGWDVGGASAAFHAAKHGQSGFSDALRHELKASGVRVSALYPPNFDDSEPRASNADDAHSSPASQRLTSREIVETVFFVIAAPRACSYPVIILDSMADQ